MSDGGQREIKLECPSCRRVGIAKVASGTARPAASVGPGFRIWLTATDPIQFVCSGCGKIVGKLTEDSRPQGRRGVALLPTSPGYRAQAWLFLPGSMTPACGLTSWACTRQSAHVIRSPSTASVMKNPSGGRGGRRPLATRRHLPCPMTRGTFEIDLRIRPLAHVRTMLLAPQFSKSANDRQDRSRYENLQSEDRRNCRAPGGWSRVSTDSALLLYPGAV